MIVFMHLSCFSFFFFLPNQLLPGATSGTFGPECVLSLPASRPLLQRGGGRSPHPGFWRKREGLIGS